MWDSIDWEGAILERQERIEIAEDNGIWEDECRWCNSDCCHGCPNLLEIYNPNLKI